MILGRNLDMRKIDKETGKTNYNAFVVIKEITHSIRTFTGSMSQSITQNGMISRLTRARDDHNREFNSNPTKFINALCLWRRLYYTKKLQCNKYIICSECIRLNKSLKIRSCLRAEQ